MRVHLDLADVTGPPDARVREAAERFTLEQVTSAEDPLFDAAYTLLDREWAASGGLEPRSVAAGYVSAATAGLQRDGIAICPHLVVARDRDGAIAGVRDGHTTVDAASGRCVVFLAHGIVLPAWRRSGVATLLRSLPTTMAREIVRAQTGGSLPTLLAAEMDPVDPANPDTIVRLIAYGRSGFSIIPPDVLPYCQPDFRALERTGGAPRVIAQLAVVRLLGHDADTLPIAWARAHVRHLHAVHGTHAHSPLLDLAAAFAERALDRHGPGHVPLLRPPTTAADRAALAPLLQSRVWGALPPELRPWGLALPSVDAEEAAL